MSLATDGAATAGDDLSAAVVGASGFAGGELLRLLDRHPSFVVDRATSREYAGRSVGAVHPNLRGAELRFTDPDDLGPVDVLFAATPHGVAMEHVGAWTDLADLVVDLSADFRLNDPAAYDEWYDGHDAPTYLDEAVYALPELHRDEIAASNPDVLATGGCNATATVLGLYPLVEAGIVDDDTETVVDVKVGSSEGGAGGGVAASHPERSGVVRPYAPTGHRHEAEIEQELGVPVSFTAHAVDMVRGASATCHLSLDEPVRTADCWTAFRDAYDDEPFVRTVAGGSGAYRYPEPKAVAGTNYADVGFEVGHDRMVVFSAIDNLTKGTAGQAVHAANVALGFEETAGLEFQGLHPVGSP
ncbi:N-acetyl-gamma-glutamyl-phosphate reductase [Halobacteriales archaeon SW_5_70_135]|nr:MAG: N-acetyl-gamma-glutamyl-phosphate reductase [Halobacteriales archaeon SW_5_70_135]